MKFSTGLSVSMATWIHISSVWPKAYFQGEEPGTFIILVYKVVVVVVDEVSVVDVVVVFVSFFVSVVNNVIWILVTHDDRCKSLKNNLVFCFG